MKYLILYTVTFFFLKASATQNSVGVQPSDTVKLPAKLVSFSSTPGNAAISLHWESEQEENLSHYELQKARLGTSSYQTIAIIFAFEPGQGNIYNYTDKKIAENQQYQYRLRMVDNDGKLTYSDMLAISKVP